MIRSSLVGAALLLTSTAALAGATRSIRQTTAKDFEEGEATASMILPTGDVVPGMKTSRIPLDATFAWCAALSPDGKTAYFGTGDQGRIFAVPMKASGADAAARKLAEVDAAWVTSLAVRPDGTIIAGTTPGGRVFSIDPRTGTSKLLAKLAAEHVWALVLDKGGTVYAATGGPGKVFAIDPKGAVRVHWDSGDRQVVSLADGGGGTLLAGTSSEAIVYRIRANGRAEALHDFEADEVRAVARTGTSTYLAVNDFDKGAEVAATTGGPTPAKGTRITTTGGAPASVGGASRAGQVKAKAAVYRLEDDGQIEQIFSLADGYFTSLLLGEGGSVYVAAGTQGKLYRIAPDRTATLAADLPERQALSMVRNPEGFLVGTGDVAGVYRVRPAGPGEATYLSKVFDAEVPARWGHLRWSGGKELVFETRSGNTAKPDKSWSDWRKLDGVTHGGAEGEGRIASGGSRYLQYRLVLPAKTSILRETTIFYLPQNQRARVTELTAESAGGVRTHSPVLKLRWKMENPDNDDLIYRLWFRQENESVWRPLGGSEPLTKAEYDWNTESVPDGRYVVRVWASDERVTPHDRALDYSYESTPFLVDNTKPEVADLQARPPAVTGKVKDDASTISAIEYSIDGADWRPAVATDGLLDQKVETFSLKLPSLAPGPHVVTVRAFDSADNIGTARVTFTVGK
jgi:outer membrane protein assembly factor BamB